jgi:hypothetical protein
MWKTRCGKNHRTVIHLKNFHYQQIMSSQVFFLRYNYIYIIKNNIFLKEKKVKEKKVLENLITLIAFSI